MQDVNIYIGTSIHGPAKKDGAYIYLLEYIKDGVPVTRDGRGSLEKTTENEQALTALAEALQRLTRPCSIRVFTGCQHILNAMGNSWARQWQKNHWKNAKGKPIKNAELWEKILTELDKHNYIFSPELHEYESWMKEELRRESGKGAKS